MNGPIERAYWVRPGLLAGIYPGDQDDAVAREKLSTLLNAGIRVFVDLTEQGELRPYEAILEELAREQGLTVRHRRRPIRDVNVPSPQHLRGILAELSADIEHGQSVYLHCWGGIGRTGTVVGCHLVETGLTGAQALERIAALRSGLPNAWRESPETPEQRRMVLTWQAGLPG